MKKMFLGLLLCFVAGGSSFGAQKTVYLPYLNNSSDWYSVFALANYGDSAVTVKYSAWGISSIQSGSEQQVTLPAKSKRIFTLNNTTFGTGLEDNSLYVKFVLSNDTVSVLGAQVSINTFNMNDFMVIEPAPSNCRRYMMPFASNSSDYQTYLYVSNIGDVSTDVTITARNDDGSGEKMKVVGIDPHKLFYFTPSLLPGFSDFNRYSYDVESSQSDIIVTEVVMNLDPFRRFYSANTPIAFISTAFPATQYLPFVLVNSEWQSTLVLANLSDTDGATVQVTARDIFGATFGVTKTLNVPAGGRYLLDITDATFAGTTTPSLDKTAGLISLKIQMTSGSAAASNLLVSKSSSHPNDLLIFNFDTTVSDQFAVPHIVDDGKAFTTFLLLNNVNSSSVSLTVDGYDANNVKLGTKTYTVGSGALFAAAPSEVFPDKIGQVSTIYVKSSSGGTTVSALVGNVAYLYHDRSTYNGMLLKK